MLALPLAFDEAEAMVDRLVIKVGGSIQSSSEADLREMVEAITSSPTRCGLRLFGSGHWNGGRFQAEVTSGTSVAAGRLNVYQDANSAGFHIELVVNPTRTLDHLLKTYGPEEFAALDAGTFFSFDEGVADDPETLDRRDNMVRSFDRIGGTVFTARADHLRRFLETFERALKELIVSQLCPPERGFRWSMDGENVSASDERNAIYLGWNGLSVSQCEIYWERRAAAALDVVARLAGAALDAARRVSVRTHPLLRKAEVQRDEAALSIRLPLMPSGKIGLAIYAKRLDRLRFEVRYLKDMPQDVRDRLDRRTPRLMAWFDALRGDALGRLPIKGLNTLFETNDRRASTTDLLDLIDLVEAACEGIALARRCVLENLLVTGGASSTGTAGNTPQKIIDRLVRVGVLTRVRLMKREDRGAGRRFALTPRFAGLVRSRGGQAA